jgi:serine/threonine-protein kinase ATR
MLREMNLKLKILTQHHDGEERGYEKSVTCERPGALYDVLNIHTYAMVNGWPEWKRSFPEDPTIAYLKGVEDPIAWQREREGRSGHRVRLGRSTKPNLTTGDFAKWKATSPIPSSPVHRPLVPRVLRDVAPEPTCTSSTTRMSRPSMHRRASPGNFQPKPSFHAMAHLYRSSTSTASRA